MVVAIVLVLGVSSIIMANVVLVMVIVFCVHSMGDHRYSHGDVNHKAGIHGSPDGHITLSDCFCCCIGLLFCPLHLPFALNNTFALATANISVVKVFKELGV